MQKARHIARKQACGRAVIGMLDQHAALRGVRTVQRVSVADNDTAARKTRLIRTVQAVFLVLPTAVVRRLVRNLRRDRAAGIQSGLCAAARRAVCRQAVRLLKLADGLFCCAVINAAYKRGGQVSQCRQPALHLSYLFAAHARRQHVGYHNGIRCAAQLVSDAHAVGIQRVV